MARVEVSFLHDSRLYDVKSDAIEKLKDTSEDDCTLLMGAISKLRVFSGLVREEGLLALKEAVQNEKSTYLKMLAFMLVNGLETEDVIELGRSEYWMRKPQGIHAMVYYIYLRGMIHIREGSHPWIIDMSFQSLVPEKWTPIYYERFGNVLDDKLRLSKIKECFFNLHPIFESMKLLENISVLEMRVKKMNRKTLQKVLQAVSTHGLTRCLYGLGREAQEKIIDHIGEMQGYMIMEDAGYLAETKVREEEVLDAVLEMNHFIDRLYYLERDGEECMQVSIYSREAVVKLLQSDFPENVAVISFYDPPSAYSDPPVDYSAKTDRVFKIAIHDIDLTVLPEYHLTYDTYFPEADQLAEFIYEAKSDGLDIICQCEHGESRSAGCAAAILEHFFRNGISVFADYRYYPNQVIYHKVFDALEKAAKVKG